MEVWIIPIFAALIVFSGYMLLTNLTTNKDSVKERVKRLTPVEEDEPAPEDVSLSLEKEKSGAAMSLSSIMSAMGINVSKFEDENEMRFYQSGIDSPDTPIYYLFFKRFGWVFGLLLALPLYSKFVEAEGMMRMAWAIVGMIVMLLAIMGPDLMLTNNKQKHQKVLERSFPDALDLLLVCVESGLALDGAMARVCKELGRAHPEITRELNRTRLELTLLNDRTQALQNLAERTGLVPFRSLVATLLQSEKFGTSLTDTLRVLSEDYRMTRLMIAENKAGRLPVLMTIPLITLLMPAFFLVILGPSIINLMEIMSD